MATLKKLSKFLGVGVAGLLGALAISAGYQAADSRRSAKKYPPPGRMVDVGGYRLHFDCVGNAEPTVVLDAGGGSFSLGWVALQPALAAATGLRVCSYDRAGLGWSDDSPGPYSIAEDVDALHRGLTALGVKGELVLVGHSYGGFLARLYASRFPGEVAGLVLVDPNTTPFFDRQPKVLEEVHMQSRMLRVAAPLGLVRLFASGEFKDGMRLPRAEDAHRMLDLSLTTKHLEALAAMLGSFSDSVAAMRALDAGVDVPLTLISRGKADEHAPWGDPAREADWRAGHRDLVNNSRRGKLVIADSSDHMVLYDQPELIVQAVKEMVSRVGDEDS